MRVIKARMKGKEARLVSDARPRDSNVVNLMDGFARAWMRRVGR